MSRNKNKKTVKEVKEKIVDTVVPTTVKVGTIEESRPTSPEMALAKAKAELDMAKRSNLAVIIEFTNHIKQYRDNKLLKEQIQREEVAIQNAYYALSIIEILEARIFELQVTNELNRGFNRITMALKMMNYFSDNADKPKVGKYMRYSRKVENKTDRTMDKYDRVRDVYEDRFITINDLVSSTLVDDLIQSGDPLERIKEGLGIKAPFLIDQGTFDFGDNNFGISADELGENCDVDDINFNDLHD